MKDKGHFIISLIKSGIRIGSCIICANTGNLTVLAIGLAIAEALVIAEELADQR